MTAAWRPAGERALVGRERVEHRLPQARVALRPHLATLRRTLQLRELHEQRLTRLDEIVA